MGGKYRLKEKFFKTNRKKDGGTIKIFADDLNPLLTFKTFLLSIDDSVRWIVKEMLEKCGLKHDNADNFTLMQIIIPARDQSKCETIKQTILRHDDCPFQLWLNYLQTHQNPTNSGSMIFKLIRIGDATIDEDLPMLIEVDSDGNNVPMPRLLKIRSNRTLIGRQPKNSIDGSMKNSFFKIDGIGIDRDHGTLQNQNGIVALIPRGETYYNGKQMKTPVILQHDCSIRFGSNVFFRFYDPLTFKRNSIDKTTMYNSLPTLATIDDSPSSCRVNVLPGLLDVSVQVESTFLRTIFTSYPLSQISFRLSPVYSLYMALRYRLSSWVNPHLSFVEKQENVCQFLARIEETIDETLEDCHNHIGYVTYWLANLSEFLFFVKHDRQIDKFSDDFRKRLVKRVEYLFYHLIDLLQNEIEKYASALINNDSIRSLNDEMISIDENLFETHWNWLKISRTQSHSMTMKNLFSILSSLMTLLRKCRVNAALTIQIFSHLFLSINTWLFNRIVCSTELNLCSNESAVKMTSHLITLRQWTEKQGLELIFDHHLTKVNQLLTFLISPKRHFLIDSSWKINSLQMEKILEKYQLDSNEMPMSKTFSQALLTNIKEQIDEKLREEGFPIELVEDRNARLPFVFPDDGYTCEHLQGIPQGLLEFIDKYIRVIPCRVFLHPASLGYWTEFFTPIHSNESHGDHSHRLETIKLMKKDNSLGLSIVAAKGEYQSCQGIYVREIVENGPAKLDGRLELGDQLLAVDKMSLIDVTQEEAAEILRKCGSSVTLQVLKNAALHQGILSLISRPIEQSYEPMRSLTPTSLPKQSERLLTSPVNRSKSVSQRKPNERPSIVLFDSNPPKLYQSQPNLRLNRERSPPLITREDIPITPIQKQSIPLVTSPEARPMRSTPLRVVSSIREKPRSGKLGVKRDQRLHDLIIKFDRTADEDKELKRLKLGEEFQRRFGQIQTLLNDDQKQKVSNGSLIDETKEFDERLKRRLEQFERERAIERVYLSQMLSKRQTDIERRLRLDRERAMRADRDIEEFHNRRLKEEEQIIEAKKEQARLLKHMHLSKAREQEYKSMIDSTVTHEIIGTSPSRKN